MPAIVEFPTIVQEAMATFGHVFPNEPERVHFAEYLTGLLGEPQEPPRIQVGGSQIDEEGALLLVEWRFPAAGRAEMIRRLSDILGQPLDK